MHHITQLSRIDVTEDVRVNLSELWEWPRNIEFRHIPLDDRATSGFWPAAVAYCK